MGLERWLSGWRESARNSVPTCDMQQKVKDSSYSYIILMGACVSCMCNVGTLQTFGVHYGTLVAEFGGDSAIAGTAWAASMCFGISMFVGPFVSAIISRFGPRVTCVAGSVLGALGFFLSSFTHQAGEFFVTYGLVVGIGSGLAYMPTVVVVHDYFEKRLSMATGLLVSSSSCGMLLIALFVQALNQSVGWRHTMRIESLLFVISGISATGFVPRSDRNSQVYEEVDGETSNSTNENEQEQNCCDKTKCDWTIWQIPAFCLYVAGTSIVMFGYMIPIVYLLDQANTVGIKEGASLLTLYGGMTMVGKLVFGFLADLKRTNHFVLLTFSLSVHGISMATIPTATNYTGLSLIVVLLGISEGCYIMLRPLLVNRLFGPERLHQAWGFVLSVNSIPYVLGPPAAGAIYKASGSYETAFYIGGACELIGCLVLAVIPWVKKRYSGFSYGGADFRNNGQYLDTALPTERDSLTASDSLEKQRSDSRRNRSRKTVLDVGSLQGFVVVTDDDLEDKQDNGKDVPIIFMQSTVPSVSRDVDNLSPTSVQTPLEKIPQDGVAVLHLSNTSIEDCDSNSERSSKESNDIKKSVSKERKKNKLFSKKINFPAREFPSACAKDIASSMARNIASNVVNSAHEVVNNLAPRKSHETERDSIPPKPKTLFAVVPTFLTPTTPYRVHFSHRYGLHETAVSKSYDEVVPKQYDISPGDGSSEQNHITRLHKYFHEMVQNSEAEQTQSLKRQNLLKYVFKRRNQDLSSDNKTSLSFSNVENIIAPSVPV